MENLPKQIDSLDCGIFMLIYALYIAIGRAFDFSHASGLSEDMPKIRRWWCLLLLRKASMKSQDSGLQFPHGTFCVPQSSLIQNILTACDWLDANKDQLVGTVLWPRILEMDEDEVTYTIEKSEKRGDDEDTEKVMSTLLFTFECMKDMNFFS